MENDIATSGPETSFRNRSSPAPTRSNGHARTLLNRDSIVFLCCTTFQGDGAAEGREPQQGPAGQAPVEDSRAGIRGTTDHRTAPFRRNRPWTRAGQPLRAEVQPFAAASSVAHQVALAVAATDVSEETQQGALDAHDMT
jgi:hypothetical protein